MSCCDACAKSGGSCGGDVAAAPQSILYTAAKVHGSGARALGATTVNVAPSTPWGAYLLVAAGGAIVGAYAIMAQRHVPARSRSRRMK